MLQLETENGQIELHRSTTLVFLDETGDLLRNDPSNPIFAIGGIVVRMDDYVDEIRPSWIKMKRDYFGADAPLHFSKMQLPSKDQIDALCSEFEGSFGRIAIAVGKSFKNEIACDPHHILMKLIQQRIEELYVALGETERLVFILEESQSHRKFAERDFSEVAWNSLGRTPEMMALVMPKEASEPGLEIADAVCHAAGGQARISEAFSDRFSAVPTKSRKDFDAVFGRCPAQMRHYTFLTRVSNQRCP